jgi:general secretion pathway protein K
MHSSICKTSLGSSRKQSGVALVMVLWILLLITISTGAYTLMARMDQLEAHTIMWGTRARMGAEAGLNMAVLSLRDPDELTRWTPDGRPYVLQYLDMQLEIMVTDERGKLNINSADETVLQQLFSSNGLEDEDAVYLAAAVLDWIDPDDIERANGAEESIYLSNGYGVGPGNRSFVMVEEILQVLGMSWELYREIEPGLSVFSEQPLPDPAFAPVEALMALPDMTEEEARNFIEERHSEDADSGVGLALPNGQVAMARGRGLTYSIQAKATLPNGIWDQIEATIQLGGSTDGRPFRILRWREGFNQ